MVLPDRQRLHDADDDTAKQIDLAFRIQTQTRNQQNRAGDNQQIACQNRIRKNRLDLPLEKQADDDNRHRCPEQIGDVAHGGLVGAVRQNGVRFRRPNDRRNAVQKPFDVVCERRDHRQQCAEMDDDFKEYAFFIDAEQCLAQREVSRARYRQKLRQALYQAQNNSIPNIHIRLRTNLALKINIVPYPAAHKRNCTGAR